MRSNDAFSRRYLQTRQEKGIEQAGSSLSMLPYKRTDAYFGRHDAKQEEDSKQYHMKSIKRERFRLNIDIDNSNYPIRHADQSLIPRGLTEAGRISTFAQKH